MVEFRLLGPVECTVSGRPVDLGPAKQRAVVAALLVDVGHPVSVETLVDRIWDDAPPAKARNVVYAHITRIRRVLAVSDGEDGRLTVHRRSGGYVLDVDRDRVDMHHFRGLAERARSRDCPDERRSVWLREAIGLWQGVPLAGLPGRWASSVREALEQQRLGAVTLWAQAETRLGRQAEVIDQLHEMIVRYPLAESMVGELMRALYLDGRAAEALDCYSRTRHLLADELGVEPGPELRDIHLAVLRGTVERPDHGTTLPKGGGRAEGGGQTPPVPAQLPADVRGFTGRATELAELSARLIAPGPVPQISTAVVISAVSGTAGVGKTALAVRWAHQVRESFPDGQLYVNLRGYDPRRPVPSADALAGFLSALGVAGQDVPLDLDERAARYRTELSGRRMLILLDNASSVEQVRPLLPGTPACVTVVTSRDSMAGLVAMHGAQRLTLDLLPPADAVALLRTFLGERADDEPEAAAVLAHQCARLPLALRVAAELATARPAIALAELVTELADHRERLDLLDAGGDPRAAVRAVFSWSYQRLPVDAARVFRLLGLHPGPDFDAYAAAALTGETFSQTRKTLDRLARAHLIQPARIARYGMHDLLRAYAVWLVGSHDGEADRQAALTGLFDHYLAAASAAMTMLQPAGQYQEPSAVLSATNLPRIADPQQARTWLDTERPILAAVSAATATADRASHATRLATTLHRYLEGAGHFTDALTIYGHALSAARQAGDRSGEGAVLTNLGVIHRWLAQYETAVDYHRRALALYQRIGDRTGEARNLTSLGVIHELLGQYGPAARHHEQALTLFRETGDRSGEADTLNNLGIIHELLNEYDLSADHHHQALALFRELDQRFGEASALGNLGIVHARLGDHETAADHYRQALALFRELGHRGGEAHALTNLGDVHTRLAQYETAADHHRQALGLFRKTGERYGEAGALNGLGEALWGAGQSAEADAAHTAALIVADEIGEREEQARAHIGLARICQAADHLGPARDHWQYALTLYTTLGSPDAAGVRDCLTALDQDGDHLAQTP